MKDYSQNGEQEVILKYFAENPPTSYIPPHFGGHALDIGANDGITLSNTYALTELNPYWQIDYVEPSAEATGKILDVIFSGNRLLRQGQIVWQLALGNEDKKGVDFYVSSEHAAHLYGPNHGLLSSLDKSQMGKWKEETFTKEKVEVLTWDSFWNRVTSSFIYLGTSKVERKALWDFISIDVEGLELDILRQMDDETLNYCKLICVEKNGKAKEIEDILTPYGFRVIWNQGENIILGK